MCRLDWEGLQELATEDLCEIFWWLRRNIERLCDLLGAKVSYMVTLDIVSVWQNQCPRVTGGDTQLIWNG